MAVLIACELLTLRFAMQTLSAVRAFVEGEGRWSKAQKDAAISLQSFALTGEESAYRAFLDNLSVQAGDHAARTELSKPQFDMQVVRRGFIQGQVHPDDIEGMVNLLRRFSSVSFIARAVEIWTQGDELFEEFKSAGEAYHVLRGRDASRGRLREALERFGRLNAELTRIEAEFSAVLGAGSRWVERVVISVLFLVVLTVEAVGLTLTLRTGRALSQGLDEANRAAARIGDGDFDVRLPVRSRDELGQLAQSINQMGELLSRSYRDLEDRVRKRTTELEVMARENARLYEQASQAVRMRDEFISIASHELKTPITGLSLGLQLLERGLGDSGQKLKEKVASCLQQSHRLAALSEELMDLTRIRLGRLEVHPEPCDLVTVVRDAALGLGSEAAQSHTELEIKAAGPVSGAFDPVRLGQVATNLISNAIKYGDSRPISVEVRRDDACALIEVKDQGRGILEGDQQRVFDRLERAGAADSKVSGLGLGLYITREIVASHGGKISVKSAPGQGSTFTVELPLSG